MSAYVIYNSCRCPYSFDAISWQAVLQAVAQDRSELATMYRRATQELSRLRAELSQRTLEVLELRQQSRRRCVVCLEASARLAFVPCGHLASCEACAAKLRPLSCPVCRGRSESRPEIW